MAVNQISDYSAVGTPAITDQLITKSRGITKYITVQTWFASIKGMSTISTDNSNTTDHIMGIQSGSPVKITYSQIITYVLSKILGYVFSGYSASDTQLQDTDEYYSDTWASKTSMPSPARGYSAASTVNKKAYVFGGYQNGVGTIQDNDEYDPDSWTSKTDMVTPARYWLASSAISSKNYVIGGSSDLGSAYYLRDTDEYTPADDTWDNKTNMPSPARAGLTSFIISSKIYVAGGNSSSGKISDTDEYNPDTWTNRANLPSPARSDFCAVTLSDIGYVFGGSQTSDDVPYIQDTDQYVVDVWTSKTNIPTPKRGQSAAFNILAKGYITGGRYLAGTDTAMQDTDEYDPDTWTNKTDMPSPARYNHTAATIKN